MSKTRVYYTICVAGTVRLFFFSLSSVRVCLMANKAVQLSLSACLMERKGMRLNLLDRLEAKLVRAEFALVLVQSQEAKVLGEEGVHLTQLEVRAAVAHVATGFVSYYLLPGRRWRGGVSVEPRWVEVADVNEGVRHLIEVEPKPGDHDIQVGLDVPQGHGCTVLLGVWVVLPFGIFIHTLELHIIPPRGREGSLGAEDDGQILQASRVLCVGDVRRRHYGLGVEVDVERQLAENKAVEHRVPKVRVGHGRIEQVPNRREDEQPTHTTHDHDVQLEAVLLADLVLAKGERTGATVVAADAHGEGVNDRHEELSDRHVHYWAHKVYRLCRLERL